METVGFIGLGIMGLPMCRNLLRAGYAAIVHDVVPAAVAAAASAGAVAAGSSSAVAARCDTVITMLPNSPHVRAALLGPDGVLAGARPGALVIDMSSIDPTVSREVGAALAGAGLRFLDAPVSGGEPKAIDGTLAIMVGGAATDFAEALPLLRCMGGTIVHCGDMGAGNVAKLANQIIVGLNLAAVAEALALVTRAGVDPATVVEAIRDGAAGSAILEAKAGQMLADDTRPGFRVDLHHKDLANALAAGRALGAPLPLTAQVLELLQAARAAGLGDADHSAIARVYAQLAGARLRSED
ncbi:MAG TPA: 2-hydroxy-3-oxopropionate reductase [Thermomicrobiales bacterium]|jgi:2-hydroxy-3-oxopropionate reductase